MMQPGSPSRHPSCAGLEPDSGKDKTGQMLAGESLGMSAQTAGDLFLAGGAAAAANALRPPRAAPVTHCSIHQKLMPACECNSRFTTPYRRDGTDSESRKANSPLRPTSLV